MKKTRLYTFGCSYTNFWWPTWADYLGTLFDETYNFGKSGGGNWLNFHSFANLINLNQIKKGDTVVIQWSSLIREIRIWNGAKSPFTPGNVLNSAFPLDEFVYKYFNPVQKGFELISYISTVKHVCKSRGINLKMFYMLEPWMGNFLGEPTSTDGITEEWLLDINASGILYNLQTLYKNKFVQRSLEDFNLDNSKVMCFAKTERFDPATTKRDHHPNPLVHYQYMSKYLLDWALNLPSSKYRIIKKNTSKEKIKGKINTLLYKSAKLWTEKLASESFIGEMYDKTRNSNLEIIFPHHIVNYTDLLTPPEYIFGTKIFRNSSIISTDSNYTAYLTGMNRNLPQYL